ncbi:MAG: pseudouridine synthase, partial [Candidatus Saccharimonadales bacterium]
IYQVVLNRPLSDKDKLQIERGVNLDDGLSRLQLAGSRQPPPITYLVTMSEGRNRQIRRTFEALGYKVVKLHRQQFGDYKIGRLTEGKYLLLT